MTNEELLEEAKEAIDKLFSDTSVSIWKAIENLEELQDEISITITALKSEI